MGMSDAGKPLTLTLSLRERERTGTCSERLGVLHLQHNADPRQRLGSALSTMVKRAEECREWESEAWEYRPSFQRLNYVQDCRLRRSREHLHGARGWVYLPDDLHPGSKIVLALVGHVSGSVSRQPLNTSTARSGATSGSGSVGTRRLGRRSQEMNATSGMR